MLHKILKPKIVKTDSLQGEKLPKLFTFNRTFVNTENGKCAVSAEVIVPALEAIWLEVIHSNVAITSEGFEILVTTLDLVEILVTRGEPIHGWIQKRLFENFPHEFKCADFQANRLHSKICRIFITSIGLEFKHTTLCWQEFQFLIKISIFE